jgi:peroxin-6
MELCLSVFPTPQSSESLCYFNRTSPTTPILKVFSTVPNMLGNRGREGVCPFPGIDTNFYPLCSQTTNMSIPSRWLKIYDPIFLQTPLSASLSENTLLVAVVQPVLLTEVIVTALSSEAYRVANAQDAVIEDWLSRNSPILRQGDLLIFNSDLMDINGQATVKSRQAYRYRLDMVEPVLQGYARKGDTRFVFIAEDALCEDIYPSDRPSGDELESDMEGIEIDESFLASSILSSPSIAPTSFQEVRAYTMNNSADVSSSSNMCGIFSEAAFLAEPLPGPVDSIEDDYTVYLRTADLSRVGVLSGHWVR